MTRKKDHRNETGVEFSEFGRLGRAGINGGSGFRRQLPECVSVADGEIVKTSLLRSVRRYRKVRLMPGYIEGLTVSQSDTYPLIPRRTKRQARSQDRPSQPGSGKAPHIVPLPQTVETHSCCDPRHAPTKAGLAEIHGPRGPDRVRLERIMISRQQKHRPVTPVTPLKRSIKPFHQCSSGGGYRTGRQRKERR
jgi:hypothetical protein